MLKKKKRGLENTGLATRDNSSLKSNLRSSKSQSYLQAKNKQFHHRAINNSREIQSTLPVSNSQNYLSRNSPYPRRRYNGNAFGGFNMSDSDFPRKSNLNVRKKAVLRIAAENFAMIKRIQRVQSSVGRYSNSPASDSKYRSRPQSSIALCYPNVVDPK